jgi:hypothetical protein
MVPCSAAAQSPFCAAANGSTWLAPAIRNSEFVILTRSDFLSCNHPSLLIGELNQHVSVAGIREFARADEILSQEFSWVEVFLQQVIPIQQHSPSFPTAPLACLGNVRFGAYERFNVSPLDGVGPLGAGADIDGADWKLGTTLQTQRPLDEHFARDEGVNRHNM